MFRNKIHFTVNGEFVEITGREAFQPLSDTLRYLFQLTGTKVVCAEGDCGACTVMISRARAPGFYSVNSCILPTFLLDGFHVVTVEGLSKPAGLNEIQCSMMRNFGGQCGFCTPGFVMSIANMYEQKSNPSEKNAKNYLTGNLCRCTGYKQILDAAQDVQKDKLKKVSELYPLKSETKELIKKIAKPILIETEERLFFAPTQLKQATQFLKEHKTVRIFSGATDIGVQINKGKDAGAKQMSLHLIEKLYELKLKGGVVSVGARSTLSGLQQIMESDSPEFCEFLNIFASPQIKNSATLVGNLANASPIADTTAFLMASDATVEVAGSRKNRSVSVCEFFKGYKKIALASDELITGIKIPLLDKKKYKIGLYKVSQRRDLDISCVNACFAIQLTGNKILDAKIALGGVAAVPLRLSAVEKKIKGLELNSDGVNQVQKLISASIEPMSDLRGTREFRLGLIRQIFAKYVKEKLNL